MANARSCCLTRALGCTDSRGSTLRVRVHHGLEERNRAVRSHLSCAPARRILMTEAEIRIYGGPDMRSCYRVAPSLHTLKLTRRNNFDCYAFDLRPVGPDGQCMVRSLPSARPRGSAMYIRHDAIRWIVARGGKQGAPDRTLQARCTQSSCRAYWLHARAPFSQTFPHAHAHMLRPA